MCDQRVVIPYHLPADGEGRSAIAVTVLIGRTRAVARAEADGMAEGRVTINGPALKPDDLGGNLELSKLQVTTIPRAEPGTTTRRVTIQNAGPA